MKRSRTKILLIALLLTFLTSGATAQPIEPTPESAYRELRSDYLKDWYVYADTVTDGILNPGDRNVGAIQNWWTPVSSGTQHNLNEGPYQPGNYTFGDDVPSAPMSYADHGDATKNVWLPRKEDRLGFYMTYSQSDNNTQNFWHSMRGDGTDPWLTALSDYYKEKYAGTNGWALGWIVNDIKRLQDGSIDPNTSPAGTLFMDIMVHNGAGTYDYGDWGQSISNPQVTQSNDINATAKDPFNGLRYPVKFNEATGTYEWTSNQARQAWWAANGDSLTPVDIANIANSMDVKERLAYDPSAWMDAIAQGKTPKEILDALGYTYDDAFAERSVYANNSTDGGVIGGLSGYDNYDPEENNWADQQVIRIDLSESTLLLGDQGEGNIDELIFYDFGDSIPGSDATQQVNPRVIAFGVDRNRTPAAGQIYLKDANTGDPVLYFPENRIYIARVVVPEPGTMLLIAFGGAALAMRRKATKTHV